MKYAEEKRRVAAAVTALQAGIPVILTDDFERENEADLVLAAELINEPLMAFFIRECSGIVCLCLTEEKLQLLDLPQMVINNQNRFQTGFTVSIEAKVGVTSGVSAADRLTTIRAAIHPEAKPSDLSRPGHVFPLRAHKGGILARQGHTEGSVELAILAGFSPAAVICELMNPNGTMMRGQEVHSFADLHDFPIVSIEDLVIVRKEKLNQSNNSRDGHKCATKQCIQSGLRALQT